MTSILKNLLVVCDARGIRLYPAGGGDLTIDAPHGALTPTLIDRLKAHKAELLAALRDGAEPGDSRPPDATAQLDGDDSFRPFAFNPPTGGIRLSAAKVADIEASLAKPDDASATAVCSCGSAAWRDVPIHGGQSFRRDCEGCGRFLGFPVWYGRAV